MPERKAATIGDVAREAGVSRQTVSNVVNSPSIVKESTRLKVQAAIEALGYSPNALARRLRTQRTSTIAVKLDPYSGGVSGVVLDRFVHALTESAAARGLRVLLYAARTLEEELRHLDELADAGEVDAIVLTGTSRGDRRAARLLERGVPFAAFGRPWGPRPRPTRGSTSTAPRGPAGPPRTSSTAPGSASRSSAGPPGPRAAPTASAAGARRWGADRAAAHRRGRRRRGPGGRESAAAERDRRPRVRQ
nr:hypothetical protein GCM10025732_07980 [Glycomyces mayteni]